MNVFDWAYLLAAVATVVSFIGTIIAKGIKHQTTSIISKLTSEYLSELKPNHGSSLRDEIKAIQRDVVELKVDLAGLEGKFIQHVKENI